MSLLLLERDESRTRGRLARRIRGVDEDAHEGGIFATQGRIRAEDRGPGFSG
jgi:hypothetical protein